MSNQSLTPAKSCYQLIFDWVTRNKVIKDKDVETGVHSFLIMTPLTVILMFSYLLNVFYTVDSPLLKTIGLICTLTHCTGISVYRITGSLKLATSIVLLSGFIFQFFHAFYTGGFESSSVIWFSIFPFLAGIILGIRNLIIWTIISLSGVVSLYFLGDSTLSVINRIGILWAQGNITIGYILVNFTLVYSYIYFKNTNNRELSEKNKSIEELLRIVSHDIANPLTVIMGKIHQVKSQVQEGKHDKIIGKCEGAEKAAMMIQEILENVRTFQSIGSEDPNLEPSSISLNDVISNSMFIFEEKLTAKGIIIDYDFETLKDIYIRAEEISIKNEVFNNLFSNSVKFLEENGKIKISVTKGQEVTSIVYNDNGVGMLQEDIDNLFNADVKTTHLGNDGEKGTGFGMPILHATLHRIGATVEVDSISKSVDNKNSGTTFKMTFKN